MIAVHTLGRLWGTVTSEAELFCDFHSSVTTTLTYSEKLTIKHISKRQNQEHQQFLTDTAIYPKVTSGMKKDNTQKIPVQFISEQHLDSIIKPYTKMGYSDIT